MNCQHTKTSVMKASFGCRKPFLAQRRRQVSKGRNATTVTASKTPRSADLEQLPPKKVSMVSLGCPKNTVDGKRFILQRHLLRSVTPLLLHCICVLAWPVCLVQQRAWLSVPFPLGNHCKVAVCTRAGKLCNHATMQLQHYRGSLMQWCRC